MPRASERIQRAERRRCRPNHRGGGRSGTAVRTRARSAFQRRRRNAGDRTGAGGGRRGTGAQLRRSGSRARHYGHPHADRKDRGNRTGCRNPFKSCRKLCARVCHRQARGHRERGRDADRRPLRVRRPTRRGARRLEWLARRSGRQGRARACRDRDRCDGRTVRNGRPGRAGACRSVGGEGGAPRRLHRRAAGAAAQGGDARRTDALRRQPRKSAVESRPARRTRRIEGGRTSEGRGEARAPCRREGHEDARDRQAARPRRHRAHRRAVRSRAMGLLGAAQPAGILRGV